MSSDGDIDGKDEYRVKVMHSVLTAVVEAGAVESSGGGVVHVHVAIEALCDAIAALENASGSSTTPRDRRETADLCRKRIIQSGSAFAASDLRGNSLPWRLEAIGKSN